MGSVIDAGASPALTRHSSGTYLRGRPVLDYDALHHPSPTPTGETVARAKRTARAEARRRYRAATEPAFDVQDDTTESQPVARAARQPQVARPDGNQKRVGIFDALKVSIHPVRWREDLAGFPTLV